MVTKEILKLQYNFLYLLLSKWGRHLHHGVNSPRDEEVKILLFLHNDLSATVFAWLRTCCLKYMELEMSSISNFCIYAVKLVQFLYSLFLSPNI